MIRKILIGVGVLILILGIFVVYITLTTKSHSPSAVASYESEEINVEIKYCRPYKKDRLIFGKEEDGALVPFGQKWRTGANEATEIWVTRDVQINNSTLKSGHYSIYTIPGEDVWQVAFNERVGYWGASMWDEPFKEEFDVLRVPAKTTSLSTPVEQFGISIQKIGSDSVKISFAWDVTQADLLITY